MRWWMGRYDPVTLFSLKLSRATASGGKTLLIPTPFAIKMAMLDAAYRRFGQKQTEEYWLSIRSAKIAVQFPDQAVVTNLFQRVLRPRRKEVEPTEPDAGPFQRTIGYREYVQFAGAFALAVGCEGEGTEQDWLSEVLLNLNYFGKRGGFFQLLEPPQKTESLPGGFVDLTEASEAFPLHGTMQVMDDCGSKLSLEKASIYTEKGIQMGKERVMRNIVIPLRPVRSTRTYTLYERIKP